MRRARPGSYTVTSAGGERVRAFEPAPLPPEPALELGGALQPALESALLALGRLDGISAVLPDRTLFLYAYVRKEAVRSIPSWTGTDAWDACSSRSCRTTRACCASRSCT